MNQYKEYVVNALLDSNNAENDYRFTVSGSYAVVSSILVSSGVIAFRPALHALSKLPGFHIASPDELFTGPSHSPTTHSLAPPFPQNHQQEQNGVLQTTTLESQSLFCPRTASHFVNTSGTPDESFAAATVGAGAITAYPHDTPQQLSDLIICPSTHYKSDVLLLKDTCEGIHCHDEALCLCSPCEELAPVQIHYSPVYITEEMLLNLDPAAVTALNSRCHRMEVCAQATQPEHAYFIINDKEYYRRENKDTLYYDVIRTVVGADEYHTQAYQYPRNPHLSIINVTGENFGLIAVEVSCTTSKNGQKSMCPRTMRFC